LLYPGSPHPVPPVPVPGTPVCTGLRFSGRVPEPALLQRPARRPGEDLL